MKKYITCFAFIFAGLLFNLNMPTKVIDKINMVTVAGYDTSEQNRIQGTVVVPSYMEQGVVESQMYTASSDTIYENRVKLNAKASEKLLNGKIITTIYSETLAKQGISMVVDFLTRDPSVDGNLYMAVTSGSAAEFLSAVETKKGQGVYFEDLFEHNIKHGNLPDVSLKSVQDSLTSETRDPFLPMFDIEEKNANMHALAFFKGDRMVDTLPIEKADVFKMMYENTTDGSYQYTSENYNVSVENIETKRRINTDKVNGNPEIMLTIHMEGAIREYTKKHVKGKKNKIEKDISRDITKQAERIIKRFQELNIDPVDFEGHFKSQERNYDKQKFKEGYQDMAIKVKTKVRLTETGIKR